MMIQMAYLFTTESKLFIDLRGHHRMDNRSPNLRDPNLRSPNLRSPNHIRDPRKLQKLLRGEQRVKRGRLIIERTLCLKSIQEENKLIEKQ